MNRFVCIAGLFVAILLLVAGLVFRPLEHKNKAEAYEKTFESVVPDFGQMADFDGNSGFIRVSNPLQLPDVQGDFTVEGYFMVDSCATSLMGYSGVISRLPAATSSSNYYGGINDSGPICEKFTFSLDIPGSVGGYTMSSSANVVPLNWNHFAVVKSGERLKLFINGVLNYFMPIVSSNLVNQGQYLLLGAADGGWNPDNPSYKLDGKIDEVRISNIARYSADFTLPGSAWAPDGNTVALYHLDGNAFDASGNGHDGVVVGNVQFMPSTVNLIPIPPNPTPTVAPTPTPYPNHNPVLQTRSLPKGRVNRPYFATILGYDRDLSDNLTMLVTGLPTGLRQGSCRQYVKGNKKYVSCDITGRPQTLDRYFVSAVVRDNRGGMDQQTLRLDIIR